MKRWYYARTNALFIFKKIKMTSSKAHFKRKDDKFINLTKCFQEFKSSMEFRNCESNTDKVKLHALLQAAHIDMILQRHAIFCIYISPCLRASFIIYMIYFALSFSFSLQLIIQCYYNSGTCLYEHCVKSSASGCCLAFL